jgi:imidazole glycerol-phosphate synthase subunit HisF
MRIRVIPVLLLRNNGLVKTLRFSDPKYVGDPINAVKIFNEKEVDELVLLDITATVEKRKPNVKLLQEIAGECFMPVCYGGGISSMEDVKAIFDSGIEKIALNTAAFDKPGLLGEAAARYGSQSILVSIDVKKSFFGKYQVYTHSGSTNRKIDPVTFARKAAEAGAGEIMLNSIDRDGTMSGYDTELVRMVSEAVNIPVIACGGAGKLDDLKSGVLAGGASAVAAGSMFVFQGRHRAVLISYPSQKELKALFG